MEESMPQDEMQELIKEFIAETEEILEGLDQCFIKLEAAPGDLVLINEIFRAVHSIKGSAGFLGFNRLVEVAHQAENILNKLRQKEMQATPEAIDIILESVDVLKRLIKEVKEGSGELIDIAPIKGKLSLLLEYAGSLEEISSDKPQAPVPASETEETVSRAAEQEKDQILRIDTNRLDQVMDLVGELVLSRNRLIKILSAVEASYDGDEKIKSLFETASNLNLITTDLQLAVMKMRMVPIRKVFNKFPRMVRDIARKANKKIDLQISGESTEIDKSVIEEIGDPLVHIIRNSIDHGIELPADRLKNDKPEYGTITLRAFQEGNSIVIQVEDDGRGIDPVAVEKKAREKGLIKSTDVRLTPKEVINFIFEPGFSTAANISDISGRGVGMDVVKTNIGRIHGIIDVNSEVGKGTRITFKIPLTLAIIQVLMVKVNGEIYALPLSSILETVRISRDCIRSIDGQEILTVRDSLIPLIRLGDVLNIKADHPAREWVYVVLVAAAEKRLGIIVDELCHQEEVVIKSVGTYFSGIKEISGATITGDGRVGLILDAGALISQHKELTGVL
ncbi:MAG: chemotaxis protein CheA [Nitrospirae bacterium]|nr:chemotaxis protein CheA [Nitrospirota bacterium]